MRHQQSGCAQVERLQNGGGLGIDNPDQGGQLRGFCAKQTHIQRVLAERGVFRIDDDEVQPGGSEDLHGLMAGGLDKRAGHPVARTHLLAKTCVSQA